MAVRWLIASLFLCILNLQAGPHWIRINTTQPTGLASPEWMFHTSFE
ncbi:uncharacterized protein METZ01_LOCUS232860, partial [marine metagenome]